MKARAALEKTFFPYIASPSRFLGNEVFKEPISVEDSDDFVTLCFAGSYEESLNQPFYELIYRFGNRIPGVVLERAFLPSMDARERLQKIGLPLFAVESRRPVAEGKAIVLYAPEYHHFPAVAEVLRLSGLPSLRAEREEGHPLAVAVIANRMNGQVLRPLVDLLVCGESPEALRWVLENITAAASPRVWASRCQQAGLPEGITLVDAQPQLAPVLRLQSAAKTTSPMHFKPLVPFHDVRAALAEGLHVSTLGKVCSDCALGSNSRPSSLPGLVQLTETLLKQLVQAGYEEFRLYCSGQVQIAQLWWQYLKERVLEEGNSVVWDGRSFSFSGYLPGHFVSWLKQQPFVLGPLAASSKGRIYLNRFYRNEDLEQALLWLARRGWKQLRLVVVFGVPGDDAAAVEQMVDFLASLPTKLLQLDPESPARLSVQLEPWLPYAFTPYQWEALPSLPGLEAVQQSWAERLTARGVPFRTAPVLRRLIAAWLSRAAADQVEALKTLGTLDGQTGTEAAESLAATSAGAFLTTGLPALSVTMDLPWQRWMESSELSQLFREKRRLGSFTVEPDCGHRVCLADGMEREAFQSLVKWGKASALPTGRQMPGGATGSPVTVYGRRGRRRGPSAPPVRQRLRVRYARQGKARFFSQGEVARAFEIAAKLGRIALIYSQGKMPRPRFSFGPPLPVGLASVAEYLDLEVELARPTHIEQQLNPHLPEGLQVVQYKPLLSKGPSLAASINLWEYEIYLESQNFSKSQLQGWLNQAEIPYIRHTAEGPVQLDLRPFVAKVELEQDKMILWIRRISDRVARVTEVLESLFGAANLDYRQFFIQRTEQWIEGPDGRISPLELS